MNAGETHYDPAYLKALFAFAYLIDKLYVCKHLLYAFLIIFLFVLNIVLNKNCTELINVQKKIEKMLLKFQKNLNKKGVLKWLAPSYGE